MRVLLVAPHEPGLPGTREEIQDIINSGLDIRLLSGTVSAEELVRECTADQFDVLWFIGHSSADGLQLSSGVLPRSQLVSMVRGCGAGLVVLNSCESVAVAQQIAEQTGADVVSTITDVPDSAAYTTGALFAQWLANTEDPVQAYQMARPGNNSTYVFIPSLMNHRTHSPSHELESRVRDLEKQVFELSVMLESLQRRMDTPAVPVTRSRGELYVLIILAGMTLLVILMLANGGA